VGFVEYEYTSSAVTEIPETLYIHIIVEMGAGWILLTTPVNR
jgi:hypothetical protein